MESKNKRRRHVVVRTELTERVEKRLVMARTLAKRTRLMIAALDRRLEESRVGDSDTRNAIGSAPASP